MRRRHRRRHRSPEEITELLTRFKESRLSRAAFARTIGVHPNTISNWMRTGPRQDDGLSLLPVRIVDSSSRPAPVQGGLELQLPRLPGDSLTLLLPRGFSGDDLAVVLRALDARP